MDAFDLQSWEGWIVALLSAVMWLAPLKKRAAAWRDAACLSLVFGVTLLSALVHGTLEHVDAASIEAMAGLGAARLILATQRQVSAYRERHRPDTVVLCDHEDHDTAPHRRS